ncbi:unnamed protein product [Cylindrotheca closterium]|uniref:Uncharacterized protein n=1 Tax=Cylindrotheca closterium TaxID=2856 RepID=A0AAD2FGM6_9STRA|nr:unnamed protein product [Cylindrotheca closterium]
MADGAKSVDEEDGRFGEDIVRNGSLWDDGGDRGSLAARSRPSAFFAFAFVYIPPLLSKSSVEVRRGKTSNLPSRSSVEVNKILRRGPPSRLTQILRRGPPSRLTKILRRGPPSRLQNPPSRSSVEVTNPPSRSSVEVTNPPSRSSIEVTKSSVKVLRCG